MLLLTINSVGCVRPIIFLYLILILFFYSCQDSTENYADNQTRTDSILDSANYLLNRGLITQADSYLDSSYATFNQAGIKDIWNKYNQKTNFYLNYHFSPDTARLYNDSMFMILRNKKQKYRLEYANSIFVKGDVLMAMKRYTEAFKQYYEGRKFARKHLDSCNYYGFTYKLGLVRYNQGQYIKAIPFLKQALAENHNCGPSSGFYNRFISPQANLNTIALCYEKAKRLDSAIYYYRQALSFINNNARFYPEAKAYMEAARGVIFGNLGGVYTRLGNFKLAEEHLKESISINDRPGYEIPDAQTAKIKLADLYIRFSHFEQSSKILDEIESYILAMESRNPTVSKLRMQWLDLKWQLSDQRNQTDKAYSYLKQYNLVKDSINNENKLISGLDMDEVFRSSEQEYQLAIISKDNQIKNTWLFVTLILFLMGGVMTAVLWYSLKQSRNINRRIARQNEQLKITQLSLEQSQFENTSLLKIVAHDLRNPIGGITTGAKILLRDGQRNSEDRAMLELILTSAQLSLDLVNDLLNKNSNLNVTLKETVDIYILIEYCTELLNFKAEKKKQRLKFQAQHVELSIDREKMWRVLSNLITNAIKFSPENTDINVKAEKLKNTVLISIEDQGIGIPEHLQDGIFDILAEGRRVGTNGEETFGLGLAICKQIVEAHNGRIWFSSKPGKGSTFYVELNIHNSYPTST